MPQVPKLQQNNIDLAPMPKVRVNTQAPDSAFGAGKTFERTVNAADRLIDHTYQIQVDEKRKADDIATTAAHVETEKAVQDLTYNTSYGLMTKKGKDAIGAHDEYSERYDKATEEIEKTLTNDDQRALYSKIKMKLKGDFNGSIQKHTFAEIQAYDDSTTDSAIKTQVDKAVLNFKDPQKISESTQLIGTLINSYADRKGMSDDERKFRTQTVLSKTHSDVIDRLLANNDDRAAKAYYENLKTVPGLISGDDAKRIDKNLEEGSTRGESQRQSDAIVSRAGSMVDALKATKGLEPKLRDATEARIKDHYQMKKAAEDQAKDQNFQTISDILESSKGDLNKIPVGMRSGLSSSQNHAIEERSRQLKSGVQPVTDWQLYTDLMTKASNPALRNDFLKTNLMEYRPRLDDAKFNHLLELRAGLQKGDDKTLSELDDHRTKTEVFKSVVNGFGIDPSPKEGSKDGRQAFVINNLAAEREAAAQRQLGRKLTNDEYKKVVESVMMEKIKVKGWLWGENEKKVHELDIGEEDRKHIIEELKRVNAPISESNIIRMYQRKNGKKQ